jgi:hypothetical protein
MPLVRSTFVVLLPMSPLPPMITTFIWDLSLFTIELSSVARHQTDVSLPNFSMFFKDRQ